MSEELLRELERLVERCRETEEPTLEAVLRTVHATAGAEQLGELAFYLLPWMEGKVQTRLKRLRGEL